MQPYCDHQRETPASTPMRGRPAPSTAFPNAQLVEVDDGTVSKTHLRLERHGDEWSVTDLHSTNGTTVTNPIGEATSCPPEVAMPVGDGWTIAIGEFTLSATVAA